MRKTFQRPPDLYCDIRFRSEKLDDIDFKRFYDAESCFNLFFQYHWPESFRCEKCGNRGAFEKDINKATVRCKKSSCRHLMSLKSRTPLYRSHIPLTIWMKAFYLWCRMRKKPDFTEINANSAATLKKLRCFQSWQKKLGISDHHLVKVIEGLRKKNFWEHLEISEKHREGLLKKSAYYQPKTPVTTSQDSKYLRITSSNPKPTKIYKRGKPFHPEDLTAWGEKARPALS